MNKKKKTYLNELKASNHVEKEKVKRIPIESRREKNKFVPFNPIDSKTLFLVGYKYLKQ